MEIFHLQEKECMAILEDANIMGRINSLRKNHLFSIFILCNAITKPIYIHVHTYPHGLPSFGPIDVLFCTGLRSVWSVWIVQFD